MLGECNQKDLSISEALKEYKVGGKKGSERADILSKFIYEINKERAIKKFYLDKNEKKVKLNPLTERGVTNLCIDINSHPQLKELSELYEFLALCKEAKSFSGKCYGTIRPKDK